MSALNMKKKNNGKLVVLLFLSFCCSCIYSLQQLRMIERNANHNGQLKTVGHPTPADELLLNSVRHKNISMLGRRKTTQKIAAAAFYFATSFSKLALAEGDSPPAAVTKYNTGKQPVVPGGKPREKGDVKGSRKDPDFLRSLSNCKSQCETRSNPNSELKSKEDCLSECQDICCKTYEQCTFAIVPR